MVLIFNRFYEYTYNFMKFEKEKENITPKTVSLKEEKKTS